jgi:hypothetical protein
MRITLTMQPSGSTTTIFGQPEEINQYTAGDHLIRNFGVPGQERWRFLRVSNGVAGEWTGDYATAEAARVSLQQDLDDRPPVAS